jgi:dihydroorotase (multifunctional complex type)
LRENIYLKLMDLVLKNGKLVTPYGVVEGGIGIEGGVIKVMAKEANLPEGDRVIDLNGRLVLPGAIDIHTHPGGKHPIGEDFKTETPGALMGGITTIGGIVRVPRMGQPFKEYTDPEDVVSWLDVFELGKNVAEENSCVDFFFIFTLNSMQHAEEIPRYIDELGVCAFKYHGNLKNVADHPMGFKWARRMALPLSYDDGLMFRAMEEIGKTGKGVLLLHCENTEISKIFRERVKAQGRTDPLAWSETLPGFLEAEHVRRYSFYSKITGSPIHIVHLTSKEGLEEVVRAKKEEVRLTVETCPQYLMIDPAKAGFLGKLNPPLRKKEDREALWKGVIEGWIDSIGTDHVVSNKYEKLVWGDGATGGDPASNIWYTGSGSVGTQTMLITMFWEGFGKRGLSLERLVELVSTNPAKIARIYPKKGVIGVGSDADLTVIDQRKEGKITTDWLRSYGDFTLFEGMSGRGWPYMTVLRGRIAMLEGELQVSHGYGKYVRCV